MYARNRDDHCLGRRVRFWRVREQHAVQDRAALRDRLYVLRPTVKLPFHSAIVARSVRDVNTHIFVSGGEWKYIKLRKSEHHLQKLCNEQSSQDTLYALCILTKSDCIHLPSVHACNSSFQLE